MNSIWTAAAAIVMAVVETYSKDDVFGRLLFTAVYSSRNIVFYSTDCKHLQPSSDLSSGMYCRVK
jgi:hypothetical protein